ncbi:unnamed protein product [marine sediment metagenome]|uniref:Uncharacterized protein n=1 Tax=marine sediment metagenome TaxID=412755 RepID=X1AFV3_9ZZZZ
MLKKDRKIAFINRLTKIQKEMLLFRKELRIGNLDEWNAKAQLVFTAAHIDAIKENLRRSMKDASTTKT